jgi:hypothetical protein
MVWKQRVLLKILPTCGFHEGFTQYKRELFMLEYLTEADKHINGLRLMLETNANCGSTVNKQ